MKRGLHQTPLAQMMLAFAGEQSLAQQDLRPLQCAALDEVALIGHQHFAHVIGMIHQIHVLARHLEVDQVAIFARSVRQEAQRIRSERRTGSRRPEDSSARVDVQITAGTAAPQLAPQPRALRQPDPGAPPF